MMKLLYVVAITVHLASCTQAAQDPLENLKSLNNANPETIDRIALHTPYGRIVVKLFDDNAPHAAAAVRQLAISKGCKGCNFYRAEARPSKKKHQPDEGPPYALLQGSLNLSDIPGSEGDLEVKAGHVAFIPNTSDFFIALGDHPEWGRAHTVFGEVEDFVSTDLIAIQPYHEVKHEQYGTVMRLMNDPVSFTCTAMKVQVSVIYAHLVNKKHVVDQPEMARARRKSSARAMSSEITKATTRTYAAALVASIGVLSLFSMTLIAPALAPASLGNDYEATSKIPMLSQSHVTEIDGGKQLAVRTGGLSLFSHRLPIPLIGRIAGAESSIFKTKDTALALYLLVPAAVSAIALVSLLWVLIFSQETETSTTHSSSRAAAQQISNAIPSNKTKDLYNQEILLHDNALFSSKLTSSSSPPTPSVEERPSGAAAAAAEEPEEKEFTLTTPPRMPESQLTSYITPTTTSAAAEDSPSSQRTAETIADIRHDDNSPGVLFLGPRASLKLPSTHSPSARAPTHKTQSFTTGTNEKSPLSGDTLSSHRVDKTIENDAFVHGEDSDVYKEIDNTGIWESAPIRIEPTPATVIAVAGEEDVTETAGEIVSEQKQVQRKSHWSVEDLKKELKATQEMVAALQNLKK